MKVLLFNGSPRANGNTFDALTEVAKALGEQGVDAEILQTGNKPIQDCIGCGGCAGKGKCVFASDGVNEWIEKAKSADGFVFGTPVYYAHPSGRILSAMDRMFYAGGASFAHKPAAVIAVARRAGTTASLDVMSKYLSISQMPIVTSTYWTLVHGRDPQEIYSDPEGLETMHNLGKNMAWILKCIEAGKKAGIAAPDTKATVRTNFVR